MRLASVIAVVGLAVASIVPATATAPPEASVRRFLDLAVPLASSESAPEPERLRRFDDLFQSFFDTGRFRTYVDGAVWSSAQPRERRALTRAISGHLATVYFDRLRIRPGQSLRIDGQAGPGTDVTVRVHSRIVSADGSPDLHIDWHVERQGQSPRIVEASFDGEIVGEARRREYAGVLLSRGGRLGSLIEWLDAQLSLRLQTER